MADHVSMPISRYRLDELGWLQFDHLCSLLVQVEAGLSDVRWRGHSDRGRVALVEDQVVLRDLVVGFGAPVTLAAVWVRDELPLAARLAELADKVAEAPLEFGPPVAGRLVVLTNLEATGAAAALSSDARVARAPLAVIGAGEIAACLDRSAELRAALPSVPGLRDLMPLIDPGALARSSFEVATRAGARSRVLGNAGV